MMRGHLEIRQGAFVRAAASALLFWSQLSVAAAPASQLDNVLRPQPTGEGRIDVEKIGLVREAALRDVALALGARAGLADRSAELIELLDSRSSELDRRYDFNGLIIGNNVLPPVISQSKDVVSLEATAMRVAGAIYRIDEPARFALPAPTWRNWLYVGLSTEKVSPPDMPAALPQNAMEQAYWERLVRQGYTGGRDQAQAVFDENFSKLERAYSGMRTYFDLWRRGMVSAPQIAKSTDLVSNEDPNTIAVGNTLFRITAPTGFTAPGVWTPLE